MSRSIVLGCAGVRGGERAYMFAALERTMRQNYPFLPYINGAPAAGAKSVGGAMDGLDKVDSGKRTGPCSPLV